ncbi:hypothetical protein Tc00.1047053509429.70 [Trypanosoma cruzi]|uniref:Uncharacterized protein n=1 Tax=Trypanosoma cruzi (strain CL Brener) TaxID=353153 RepID=Q4E0M3_TRYCC|nr:hypothetical protein Tc00.1047053509429.70 [Trypanosoma cruzi]EAN98298.1 hypothetical protein Tc00.1047053509429.70 [Trypanosoma cruzi]|eukprot:XP_820149.1 hypothetical protein [Trypanosoma cruzi strain CL Brener]
MDADKNGRTYGRHGPVLVHKRPILAAAVKIRRPDVFMAGCPTVAPRSCTKGRGHDSLESQKPTILQCSASDLSPHCAAMCWLPCCQRIFPCLTIPAALLRAKRLSRRMRRKKMRKLASRVSRAIGQPFGARNHSQSSPQNRAADRQGSTRPGSPRTQQRAQPERAPWRCRPTHRVARANCPYCREKTTPSHVSLTGSWLLARG